MESMEELINAGMGAHLAGDYALEITIWKKVCISEPENMRWQSNLAMAFHRYGETTQASILFQYVIRTDPSVSQAHNNYAALLVECGTPVGQLLPAFHLALHTSETKQHFIRHLFNLCLSASLGSDGDGDKLLDFAHESSKRFLERVKEEPEVSTFAQSAIESFRRYVKLRSALTRRDWRAVNLALNEAKDGFAAIGLDFEVHRIELMRPVLTEAENVMTFLERCGTDPDFDIPIALDAVRSIHSSTSDAYDAAIATGHSSLINILGWAVFGMRSILEWASEPTEIVDLDLPRTCVSMIAQGEYSDFGERISNLFTQSQRVCERADSEIKSVRTTALHQDIISSAWQKIQLHVRGTFLDFEGIGNILAREMVGWNRNPAEALRGEIGRFVSFVEAQAFKDIFVDGKPQENIARALLQAFMANRGYREVPSRGGRVDVLVFFRNVSFVVETKIWRGPEHHESGLKELQEYVSGNAFDRLAGQFYVVFDPTRSCKASAYVKARDGGAGPQKIETIVVSIAPPTPSKIDRMSHDDDGEP